jgi:hypothetical protein
MCEHPLARWPRRSCGWLAVVALLMLIVKDATGIRFGTQRNRLLPTEVKNDVKTSDRWSARSLL